MTSFVLPAATLWQRELVRFWRQRSRVLSVVASPLIFWLLGRGVAMWGLERATSLRRWMLISFSLCHIPFIIRLLGVESLGDKLTMLVLIVLSGLTIFACARFGHRLLNEIDSRKLN